MAIYDLAYRRHPLAINGDEVVNSNPPTSELNTVYDGDYLKLSGNGYIQTSSHFAISQTNKSYSIFVTKEAIGLMTYVGHWYGDYADYRLFAIDDTKIYFMQDGGSTAGEALHGLGSTWSSFKNIIITYDGVAWKLFIDNVEITVQTQPSSHVNYSNLIGATENSGYKEFVTGKIAELSAFELTLDSTQRTEIFTTGVQITPHRHLPLQTVADEIIVPIVPTVVSNIVFADDVATFTDGYAFYPSLIRTLSNQETTSFWASKTSAGLMTVLGREYQGGSEQSKCWIDDVNFYWGDYTGSNFGTFPHGLGATWNDVHFWVEYDYDVDIFKVYIDNVEKTGTLPQTFNRSCTFNYLGATETTGNIPYLKWTGNIGDVRVHDRLLTAQDRLAIFDLGSPLSLPNVATPSSASISITQFDPSLVLNPNTFTPDNPISITVTPQDPFVDGNQANITVDLTVTPSLVVQLQTPTVIPNSLIFWDDDLDPFGDGSLTQSWNFESATTPHVNLQGTNSFTTDWTPATLEDGGLGKYPQWTTRTAGYYEPETAGGHGIVGDVPCSFTLFFHTSYFEGINFSFGSSQQRYNVEISKAMGDFVSQNVFVTLHKDAVSLDCGAVADGLHSVQYTYDGAGTSRIYLDGVFKGTLSLTMKFINNPLALYCYYSASDDYLTNVDQVCVWNRQLSQDEVTIVSNTQILAETPVTVDIPLATLALLPNEVSAYGNSVHIELSTIVSNVTAVDPIIQDDNYGTKVTDESLDPLGDGSLEQSFTFNGGKLTNEQNTNEFISPINGTIVSLLKFGDGIRNTYLETDTTLNGHGQSGNNHSFAFWAYCGGTYTHVTLGGEGNLGNVEIEVWASSSDDQCAVFLKINNRQYESVALSRACISGQLNLFTYTYSGGANRLYINGTEIFYVGMTNNVVSTQPISISAYDFNSTGTAYIDQIMVFNKTLSLANVQTLNAMENSQSYGEIVNLEAYRQATITAKNPTIEIVYPIHVTVNLDQFQQLTVTPYETSFGIVTEVDLETSTISITGITPTVSTGLNGVYDAVALDITITAQDPEVVVPAINVTVDADTSSLTVAILEPIVEVFAGRKYDFEIVQVVDIVKIRYTFDIVQENEVSFSSKIIVRSRY